MNKKKKCVGICIGGSCYNNGSENIMNVLEKHYSVIAGDSNDSIELDFTGCLGNCDFGVNMEIDGAVITNVTKDNVIDIIENENKNFNDTNNQIPKNSLEDLLSKELGDL